MAELWNPDVVDWYTVNNKPDCFVLIVKCEETFSRRKPEFIGRNVLWQTERFEVFGYDGPAIADNIPIRPGDNVAVAIRKSPTIQ